MPIEISMWVWSRKWKVRLRAAKVRRRIRVERPGRSIASRNLVERGLVGGLDGVPGDAFHDILFEQDVYQIRSHPGERDP